MKTILLTVTAILSYIGASVSCLWAIIEFILYLVKDKTFNWWSVWSILIFGALSLIMFLLSAYSLIQKRREVNNSVSSIRKSRFQEKIEQMQRERSQNT